MKRAQKLILGVVVLLSLVSSLTAQHKNHARGFDANGVYSLHDIDSINVFNGNLNISIPIGGPRQVNGSFSYQISLSYNSNLWRRQERCPVTLDPNAGRENYHARYGNYAGFGTWYWERVTLNVILPDGSYDAPSQRGDSDGCFTYTEPNELNNAGHGWELNLGKLGRPLVQKVEAGYDPFSSDNRSWIYFSPDGNAHSFYTRLHEDDPVEPGDELGPMEDPITYTRDGSYLRQRLVGGVRYIDFPNGDVHKFVAHVATYADRITQYVDWRLVEMRDAASSARVTIDYVTNPDYWAITEYAKDTNGVEQQLRQHAVNFRTVSVPDLAGTPGNEARDYKVVSSVNFAGFTPPGSTTPVPQVYTFQNETTLTIMRATPNLVGFGALYTDRVTVPFLTSITLPDSSQYSMPLDTSYDTTDDGAYSSPFVIGVIRGITLPTGARIDWSYRPQNDAYGSQNGYGYRYPDGSGGPLYTGSTTGVRVRTLTVGGTSYTWTYNPKLDARSRSTRSNGVQCTEGPEDFRNHWCTPKEFVNTVTDPLGNYTEHYFSVYPFATLPTGGPSYDLTAGRDVNAWHAADYGLPITKWNYVFDAAGQNRMFLSQKIYNSGGTLVRTKYLRYETDKVQEANGEPGFLETNRRVVAERTVYNDDTNDGLKYAETQYSNFDGLGHYRRSQTAGNFITGGAGNVRIEEAFFNQDASGNSTGYNSGTFQVNPATNTQVSTPSPYVSFPSGRLWVLGRYTGKLSTEAGKTARNEFYFDNYGRLLRKRTYKEPDSGANPQQNAHDLIVEYAYENGNMTSEKTFGGDIKSVAINTPLYSINLTGPETNITHTYQYGRLATSKFERVSSESGKNLNYLTVNNTIDQGSGLISKSTDPSGIETNYLYDEMGRVTGISTTGSSTQISYTPRSATTEARVVVNRYGAGGTTGAVIAKEEFDYDGLGRLHIERKQLPNDQGMTDRETLYNGMGWKLSVSEWGASGKKTEYKAYDPFGRVLQMRAPDGSFSFIRYRGDRKILRTAKAGTALDANGNVAKDNVTTEEIYDRQGRLQMVKEKSRPDADVYIKTNYGYDIGNRLSSVITTSAIPPLGAASQSATAETDNEDGSPTVTSAGENPGAVAESSASSTSTASSLPANQRTNVALTNNWGWTQASGQFSDNYPAAALINGDRRANNWGTAGLPLGGWNDATQGAFSSDWVNVNFNATKEVGEIVVYTLQDDYAKGQEPTADETFQTADNTGQGIVDFDIQYLSGSGWKTVPGGRITDNNRVSRRIAFAPVRTTAIRVAVHKAVEFVGIGNNFSRIIEVEAYGRSNVALASNGAQAAASSSTKPSEGLGNYEPIAAINGERLAAGSTASYSNNTFWRDGTADDPKVTDDWPDWLEVKFAGQKTINEISVYTLQDNFTSPVEPTEMMTFTQWGITDFEVQYATGTIWTTVPGGNVTGNNKVWRKFKFAPVTTDKIRVHITSALGERSRIVELEAWGFAATGNLALGKPATQSSTVGGAPASRAVDSNRDGNFTNNSVTHTDYQSQPWWQVDLGSVQPIDQIRIWNRTDCCAERLTNFHVLVSDQPFNSNDLAATLNQNGVADYYRSNGAGSMMSLNVARTGRYVRVQLADTNFLSLAEVEVLAPTAEGTNVALASQGAVATASSVPVEDPQGIFEPSAAINGDRRGLRALDGYSNNSIWRDTTPDDNLPGGNDYPDWLQVQFAGPKTINEINVITVQDNTVTPVEPTESMTIANWGLLDFEVQYWNGTEWTTVPGGRVSGNNKVWRKFAFAAITTEKIRVLVSAARSGFSRIVELEAMYNPLTNFALNKVATQSTTAGSAPASRAIDGNRDGSFNNNSVTHTAFESQPWWQVDLGSVVPIDQIKLWNRTDCCAERLTNFHVFVSDQPFTSTDLAAAISQPGVFNLYSVGDAGPQTSIKVGRSGRYVRVQLAGNNFLSLAEVEVLGDPVVPIVPLPAVTKVALVNIAREAGTTVQASSEFNSNYAASAIIDGDRTGKNWGKGGYGSGWNDGTQGSFSNDWVELNFQGQKSLEELDVYTISDNYATRNSDPTAADTFGTADNSGQGATYYELQYLDGSRWKRVPGGLVRDNAKVWKQFAGLQLTTTKVRALVRDSVVWTSAGNNYSRLIEVEAWGTDANPAPPATPASDVVWVEDGLPTGANPVGANDLWDWGASPRAISGNFDHRSWLPIDPAQLVHQHYFEGATQTLAVNPGDTLVTYIYIDPLNPPREVMLQWKENSSWEHRAYWGENLIAWGVNNQVSRQPMGALPAAGQWVRLEVPASAVGLEGKVVNGMAFSLYGGRAAWDRSGKSPGYQGYHDSVDCSNIRGWAWDPKNPGTRLNVSVYDDSKGGVLVASGTANQFRQDLLNAGKGDGACGFTIPTPASLKDGQNHSLRVQISGTPFNLANTPRTFNSGATCTNGPAISINDVVVTEGAGSGGQAYANFVISLSQTSTQMVSVKYGLQDVSATLGADYRDAPPTYPLNTLNFAPGDTTYVLSLPIINDTLPEQSETFFLNLFAPINATITDNQGKGTIIDPNAPPSTPTPTPTPEESPTPPDEPTPTDEDLSDDSGEPTEDCPTCVTQIRTFEYDNRGFLKKEMHPELSAVGITYTNYDSAGRVGQRFDGQRTLKFVYDDGGRLRTVSEIVANTEQVMKEFEYDTGGGFMTGRLVRTRRVNRVKNPYVSDPTEVSFPVSEYFAYNNRGLLDNKTTQFGDTGAPYTFYQSFTYDGLGNLNSQNYPECTHAQCTGGGQAIPRTISYGYSAGWLSDVGTGANVNAYADLSYYTNGMLQTVAHGGTTGSSVVKTTYARDPNFMQRIGGVSTANVANGQDWNSGPYQYDSFGNIVAIGGNRYLYDKANRVVSGTASDGTNKRQTYTYDSFGNIRRVITYPNIIGGTATNTFTVAVDSTTNRLTGVGYDAAGNMLADPANPSAPFTYDAFNMVKYGPGRTYLYNASDERVWIINGTGVNALATFSLRGLNNEVLRDYQMTAQNQWTWQKDYVYRGNTLLASIDSNGTNHYSVDHLGSPRLVTNAARQRLEYHQYLPFGQDVTAAGEGRLRFTGHERDSGNLDYMHARYYYIPAGKFMSLDPGRDVDKKRPQSWNLYSYVRNNPVNSTDPTGRCSAPAGIGRGEVGICMEAFIGAGTIHGFGFGNKRGFSATDGGLEAKIKISAIIDYRTGAVRFTEKVQDSRVGFRFGYIDHIVTLRQGFNDPPTKVTSSAQGSSWNVNIRYNSYNGFANLPIPQSDLHYGITANVNFVVTGDGRVGLNGGSLDGYPSTAAYAYDRDGNVVQIFKQAEGSPTDLAPPMEVTLAPTVPKKPGDN